MDETLEKLLCGGNFLNINNSIKNQKSTFNMAMANTWPIATVLRYISVIVELPQYSLYFQRAEIDGMTFICMNSPQQLDNLVSALQHPLHALKILSHAKVLRERYFYIYILFNLLIYIHST